MTEQNTETTHTNCTACLANTCQQGCTDIFADCNSPGPAMVAYVPELEKLAEVNAADMMRYVSPNTGRDEIGMNLAIALARMEGVALENLAIAGSGLDLLKLLPNFLDVNSVVSLAGDFPGYFHSARDSGLQHILAGCPATPVRVGPERLASAIRRLDRPLVLLSAPITNPGQNLIDKDFIAEILSANRSAVVLIDGAYRRAAALHGLEVPDYAAYARAEERLIYMNVAAKDLGACGTRISWIAANRQLIHRLKSRISPYPVSAPAARFVAGLAPRQDVIRSIHETQSRACAIIVSGLRDLGFEVRWQYAPWCLVYAGKDAAGYGRQLREHDRIHVQDQTGLVDGFEGWIRISATVPCEARRIVAAFRACTIRMRTFE